MICRITLIIGQKSSIAYMYGQKDETTDTPVSAEMSEYDRSIAGASDGSIDS